jgi:hypothetical protein
MSYDANFGFKYNSNNEDDYKSEMYDENYKII